MSIVTTKDELLSLFSDLGLKTGDDIMVHSSMRTLGHVVNGALDVIDALVECVDINKGTILMPSHTGQLTDPSEWTNPPLSKEHVDILTSSMLPFDKKITPIRGRGIVSETFLSYPGIRRSEHPLNSVSALGKRSSFYTNNHDFDEPEGINSPVGKLYKNNGNILGIGVNRFTAIHLAEYIADVDYLINGNPSVLYKRKNGRNIFKQIKKYPGSSDNFNKVLPILRGENLINEKNFKLGTMTYFTIRPVIDCIVDLLKSDPKLLIRG